MSYRVRYTFPDGRTGHWMPHYGTREDAQRAIDNRIGGTGLAHTVEEVPALVSMAAHHIEILRERFKELEEIQKAIDRDLALAIQLGDALRQAMRTGAWRAGDDTGMASNAIAGWDRFRPGLAKATSVPVGASEAHGEGGDSDRKRLEALRAFLEGNEDASVSWWEDEFNAVAEDVAITAPTLAALADKLAVKEAKP